jgi:hypothetical protein
MGDPVTLGALHAATGAARVIYNAPETYQRIRARLKHLQGTNEALSSFRSKPQEYMELLVMMLYVLTKKMSEKNHEDLKSDYLEFSNILRDTFLGLAAPETGPGGAEGGGKRTKKRKSKKRTRRTRKKKKQRKSKKN